MKPTLCEIVTNQINYVKISREKLHRLKVHKRKNFLGSDFEFCTFLLLLMLKYYSFAKQIFDRAIIKEDTIVPLILRLSRIDFSLY
jgi:hypothetical protein